VRAWRDDVRRAAGGAPNGMMGPRMVALVSLLAADGWGGHHPWACHGGLTFLWRGAVGNRHNFCTGMHSAPEWPSTCRAGRRLRRGFKPSATEWLTFWLSPCTGTQGN
jgi:hypothetical protein